MTQTNQAVTPSGSLGFINTTGLGDSIRLSNGNTGGANTQTYMLDNLSVAIPEPASAALAGLGALLALPRRRRS